MKRLMEWCQVDDHAGVKGQSDERSVYSLTAAKIITVGFM